MDMEMAARSRDIDPSELGRRIKAARIAAGLTQAALADGLVTAAYVSRIEAGQRRPELRVLQAFCDRFSVDLSTLLEDPDHPRPSSALSNESQLALDHAELHLASGNPSSALTALADLRNSVKSAPDSSEVDQELWSKIDYLEAMAYEALGNVDEALPRLRRLVDTPWGDPNWLRAAIALSRTYREVGDVRSAIESGQHVLELVDSLGLGETTEAVQLTVTVANAYVVDGRLDYALSISQRALQIAERAGSITGQASAYWSASNVASKRHDDRSALTLARKALAMFELGSDFRNLARLRVQVGLIQLRQDPPDAAGAKATLEAASNELDWTASNTFDRVDHQLALARANLLLGDVAVAEGLVDSADLLIADRSPALSAQAEVLRGQIAMHAGQQTRARQAYQRGAGQLSRVGLDRDIAELWFELGGLLSDAGAQGEALDAYRRGAVASGLASAARAASHASTS